MGIGIVKSFSFPDGIIRGDTFYIKHLSNNFTVIDCYLKDGTDRNCRKKKIIDEILQESKGRVTRFISTHPDDDHIIGIDALDRSWTIENFYAVKNDIPNDGEKAYLVWYSNRLTSGKYFEIKKGLCKKWLNCGDKDQGSSGLFFLWPDVGNEAFVNAVKAIKKGESPNNISCVVKYSIAGGPSYLWMGDMETDMQKEFLNECKTELEHVDVFFHPHHGRESSKPPKELLELLTPKIIVIGNAPDECLNRDNSDLTLTQNRAGDIVFCNDLASRKVHVFTSNMPDNLPKCLIKDQSFKMLYPDMNYQGSFGFI